MSPYRCGESLRARRGLTLLELIVSLGILAVMSTIVVTSLDPLADQARYEATQRLLVELRRSVVGDAAQRQINGQPIITGYLADTGTLPLALTDLTSQPIGLAAYAVQSFDSDRDLVDDVRLTSGWRGPYLQFGPGQTALVDGWGRSLLINPDGGEFDFTSLGSDTDSAAPEDGYRADLSVVMPQVQYRSDAVFRLFAIDDDTGARIDPSPSGTEQLGVMLYAVGVAGGTTGAIEEVTLPVAASGSFEALKSNLPHGTAAARAVMWSDADADDQLDAGEAVLRSSYVHYFTIVGGADVRIEMELR